ncbi:DMT family transporter [Actinomycetospora rhizophila]|uniref:DMT family transporter n=1 Tax=Actinomycetospora rhizophila TaxID=1416876 RepID=A0ABV9Z8A3_9PSEU
MTANSTIAVALACCSALAYALSAALQRRETGRTVDGAEHAGAGLPFFGALLRRPWWWGGVAAMVVGAMIHVVALGFGSITLVQPIGVTALILALPLDAWLERRRIHRAEWFGAVVLVIGLAGLFGLAEHQPSQVPPDADLVLGTLVVVLVLAAVVTVASGRAPPVPRAVVRAAVSGLCAGATSGLVRLTFRLVQDGRSPWLIAAVLGAATILPVASILLLQTAYRDGGLDAGLSTQITVDQVAAMAIGIVVLGERFSLGVSGAVLAGLSAVVAVTGLVTLIRSGPTPEQRVPATAGTAPRP